MKQALLLFLFFSLFGYGQNGSVNKNPIPSKSLYRWEKGIETGINYCGSGRGFAPDSIPTEALVDINYKCGKIANTIQQRDSVLDLYRAKRERKLFVKIFYSQQISTDSRTPSNKRFEDSYYGNSHTTYRYDGNSEVPQGGQEFGVLLEIKTRKHFNINTGLTYDLMRFQTKETTLFYSGWGDVLGNYSGSYKNTKIKYKFEFFTIPVIFNFVHNAKKCNFYAGIGIELKKLFSSELSVENSYFKKIYTYHFGEPGYKTDPLNFFSVTNIGIDIPVSKKATLFLEPNFKFELGRLHIPVNSTEVQLWSAGCKVGLKF